MAAPEIKDMDRGWAWVVMVAACMLQIIIGVDMYSLGVMQIVLLDTFDAGLLKTTWVLSLSTCMMNLPGPFVGLLMNITSCRTTMLIGSAFLVVGVTASAFATCLEHLYITLSLLMGTGMGLVYSPALVVLGFYFDKHLSVANAIVVTGGGIGMLAGPPMVSWLHSIYGWRGMFLVLGAISANVIVCAIICRPNSLERSYSNSSDSEGTIADEESCIKKKQPKGDLQAAETGLLSKLKSCAQAINNMPVLLFCSSTFLWSITISVVNLHLPRYVVLQGASTTQSSLLFTSMGVCNIASRLMSGFGVNSGYLDQYVLYTGSFTVMALLTIALPFVPATITVSMAYAGLFGLCTGGPYVVLTSITKDLVGLSNLAVVFGVEMLVCGLGSLLGPPIAGMLVEKSDGSYMWSFIWAGSTCGASAFLCFLLMKCRRPNHSTVLEVDCDIPAATSRPSSFLWASQLSIPGAPSPCLHPRTHKPLVVKA